MVTEPQLPVKFSVSHIRKPADTDGRQVLTAFWSDDSKVSYALVKAIPDTPQWFTLSLDNSGNVLEETKLPSSPKITYTPLIPVGGIYSEYQGEVSPTGRYKFKIFKGANYSLYLIDTINQSKIKLLESSDMNFRTAYWTPGETIVAFAIGPEFGTEKYLYDVVGKRLSPIAELIGFDDPNIFQWSLSPNGKHILFANDGNLSIFLIEDGAEIRLSGSFDNVRWSGNGQRIYFYYGDRWDSRDTISYYDLAAQKTIDLAKVSDLEKLVFGSVFDVSPDGENLVFWGGGDIWLITSR